MNELESSVVANVAIMHAIIDGHAATPENCKKGISIFALLTIKKA